jgi:uncharacterized membrane protein
VLGLGLGGFVDGITLHQIMQWHNMGSAVLPPTTMDAMAKNMVGDGMFHAATLLLTLVGVLMLWSDGVAGRSPGRLSVLVGRRRAIREADRARKAVARPSPFSVP